MSSILSKLFFLKRNSNRSGCHSASTKAGGSSNAAVTSAKHKHQPLVSPFSPTFAHVAPAKPSPPPPSGSSTRSHRNNSSFRRPLSIINEQYQEVSYGSVYTGPAEKTASASAGELAERAQIEAMLASTSLPPQIALIEEIVEAERHSGDSSATVSSFSSTATTNSDQCTTTSASGGNIRVGGHRVKANHFFADFQLKGFTPKETTVRLFFSRSIVVNCSHKEEDRESGSSEFRTYMKKVMLPAAGTVDLQHISCKVYPCGLLRVQAPYLVLTKEANGGAGEVEEVQVVFTEVTNIRKRSGKCSHH